MSNINMDLIKTGTVILVDYDGDIQYATIGDTASTFVDIILENGDLEKVEIADLDKIIIELA
jgi:hypothetical protein